VAATVRLIDFKAVGTSLGFAPVSSVGRVEHTATGASNPEAEGPLALNLIPQLQQNRASLTIPLPQPGQKFGGRGIFKKNLQVIPILRIQLVLILTSKYSTIGDFKPSSSG
jgi:hypothetical protein